MSKRVLAILAVLPVAALGAVVWRITAAYGTSAEGAFFQWGPWVSAAVTFIALVAAAAYYFRAVVQARSTHQFDVLMRTVAVYHEFMSTKRVLAAGYLRASSLALRPATPAEQLAIIDLMNYFDGASWRSFTVFSMNLGSCRLNVRCEHHWRPAVQQRHEGVRLIIHEIGYPAWMYHHALVLARQDTGGIVSEFPLGTHTQFDRLVSAMQPYIETLVYGGRTGGFREREQWTREAYDRFIERELAVRRTRPDADLSRPSAKIWQWIGLGARE